MGRTYDTVLECGCQYSSDGGGGLMPCCYDEPTDEEMQKCEIAHKKWKESGEEKKYLDDCHLNNCDCCDECKKILIERDSLLEKIKQNKESLKETWGNVFKNLVKRHQEILPNGDKSVDTFSVVFDFLQYIKKLEMKK